MCYAELLVLTTHADVLAKQRNVIFYGELRSEVDGLIGSDFSEISYLYEFIEFHYVRKM